MNEIGFAPQQAKLEELETKLLLDGVFSYYGYDFRNYAVPSLKRRIADLLISEGLPNISSLQARVLRDLPCMERFIAKLSINVTSMFRDPAFYLTFRKKLVPYLKTYPFIRIWHAGCATGEEVYSLAILLQEENLYQRCRIYATDFNEKILHKAQSGIFPLANMQEYTRNYQLAGGTGSFSSYYTAQYGSAIFHSSLKQNMVFSVHNLVTDGSFNEFNVVLCRNVMIYFNNELRARVFNLIYKSLNMFGYLGLGSKESLRGTPEEHCFEDIDPVNRISRKIC